MSDITNFTEITDGLDPDDIIYAGRPSDTGNADKNTKKKNMLLKGIHLNPNRIALQELVSGILSVSGYYTIAKTEAVPASISSADFKVSDPSSGLLACKISAITTALAKTHINTTIKLTSNAANSTGAVNQVEGYRLAKSDSVGASGFKLQVFLNPFSARVFYIQMVNNFAESNESGFQLVTPYLDNTPTLPDGVTVGTFLEAGEELVVSNVSGVRANGKISAIASGNDQLRVTAIWDEIPMQATNVSITGFTSFRFFDLDRNGSVTLGSFTTAAIVIKGKVITFNINQTGIATGLATFEPLAGVFDGADGKLILS